MTKEEAKEILENTTFIAPVMADVDTALDMAISALSENFDPNDMTHIFDGVTKISKDAFKGWTTEELLEQVRKKENGDFVCHVPKRMTNGEVMKAVFPNCYIGIDDDEWIVTNIDGRTMFQPEWWDAPYKAESEVKDGRN